MGELINEVNSENKGNIIERIDFKVLLFLILKHKFKIILFTLLVTLITIVYALSKPSIYKSNVVLSPQSQQKSSPSGGLSSLASLAGISLGSSSSNDPSVMFKTILYDYSFNEYMIKKYDLINKLANQKNLVFSFGYDGLYNLFNGKKEDSGNKEHQIHMTIKSLTKILSFRIDEKTSMIIFGATLADRYLAKKLVDIYLKEVITKLKEKDFKEIDEQIKFYSKQLSSTYDVSLKEQLSKSLSALMQKKVFLDVNEYYQFSKVIDSRIPNQIEMIAPNRKVMVIKAFIVAFVMSIVLILVFELIKLDRKEED